MQCLRMLSMPRPRVVLLAGPGLGLGLVLLGLQSAFSINEKVNRIPCVRKVFISLGQSTLNESLVRKLHLIIESIKVELQYSRLYMLYCTSEEIENKQANPAQS